MNSVLLFSLWTAEHRLLQVLRLLTLSAAQPAGQKLQGFISHGPYADLYQP